MLKNILASPRNNQFGLFSLLAVKAALALLLILFAGIGLGPDEAQYWTWSRHLDFGYYSKPPGIAWQIFLSTLAFGPTELGVRFGPAVIGTFLVWAVYRLAITAQLNSRTATLAALLTAFTPFGIFAGFLAITDGGMLLFWVLGLTEIVRALEGNTSPSYVKIGLWIACGALFKWPIYLLWAPIAILFFLRSNFRDYRFFFGALLSLLGLLPSLYWNVFHEFATFKHVTTIVEGSAKGNPLEFLGSQAMIVSPLLFLLLIVAWFRTIKSPVRAGVRFLGFFSLGFLLLFMIYACFRKGQGNWCLFIYPAVFVVLAAAFQEKSKWLLAGVLLGILMTVFAFALPLIQKQSKWLPWKINPFRHNLGWEEFQQIPFDPTKEFLLADKYQITSLLSFYSPDQTQAYFFNLLGTRKNQFSYWPGPNVAMRGRDGLFFVVENAPNLNEKLTKLELTYPALLKPYFESVASAERIPLFKSEGEPVKTALMFRCQGYRGNLPADPEKY